MSENSDRSVTPSLISSKESLKRRVTLVKRGTKGLRSEEIHATTFEEESLNEEYDKDKQNALGLNGECIISKSYPSPAISTDFSGIEDLGLQTVVSSQDQSYSSTHNATEASSEPASSSFPFYPTPSVNLSSHPTIVSCHDALLSAAELLAQIFASMKEPIYSMSTPSARERPNVDERLNNLFSLSSEWRTPNSPLGSLGGDLFDPRLEATADRMIRALFNETNQDLNQMSQTKFQRYFTVFAGSDPDAVCSVALLKHITNSRTAVQEGLSERFGINLHLIPISCYTHLRQAIMIEYSCLNHTSNLYNSSCIFFINVGSRQDVRKLLLPPKPTRLNWKPRIFIIDYHRPVEACYFTKTSEHMFPYSIVCTAEELNSIEKEHERYQTWKLRSTSSDARLEDCVGDDEDILGDLSSFEHLDCFGEYNACPSALVVLEALRYHCLETPAMFFLVASSLAYHLLIGNLSRKDYAKHLRFLHQHFHHLSRRFIKTDSYFQILKPVTKELLIPLFRFTSIEDALRHSTLFLRAQTSRFATLDVVESELATLRVLLALKEKFWKDQFRFLNNAHQKQLIHNLIPEVLTKVTLESRDRLPQRYPDDQETHYLTSTLAFVLLLSSVGLPDRISSLDMGFLLLSLLSRPSPRKNIPTQQAATESVTSYSDLPDLTSWTADAQELYVSRSAASGVFFFEYPFVEALEFLESIVYATESNMKCCDTSSLKSNTFSASSGSTEATDFDSKPNHEETTLYSFGNIWDSYSCSVLNEKKNYVSGITTYQSHQRLARLSRIALQVQRDMTQLVLRLLKKRRVEHDSVCEFRRAVGNIEGYLENAIPKHLYHPLLLRYCACVTSDCIARGVSSASPGILLFVNAPHEYVSVGSAVLGFSPNTTMRTPSKLGVHIYHNLNFLKTSGMIENVRQDDFDASIAFVPINKLHTIFSALFTQSHVLHSSRRLHSPSSPSLSSSHELSQDLSPTSSGTNSPNLDSHSNAECNSPNHISSTPTPLPFQKTKRRRLVRCNSEPSNI